MKGKLCPLLSIANRYGPDTDPACVGEECALWNEYQHRCGLISQGIARDKEYERQEYLADARDREKAREIARGGY